MSCLLRTTVSLCLFVFPSSPPSHQISVCLSDVFFRSQFWSKLWVGATVFGFRSRSRWLERFDVQIGDLFILLLCGGGGSVDGGGGVGCDCCSRRPLFGGGGCVDLLFPPFLCCLGGDGVFMWCVPYFCAFFLFPLPVRWLCVSVLQSRQLFFACGSPDFTVDGRFVFVGLQHFFWGGGVLWSRPSVRVFVGCKY